MDNRFLMNFVPGYADFISDVLMVTLKSIEESIIQNGLNDETFIQRAKSICEEFGAEMPCSTELKEILEFTLKVYYRKVKEAKNEVESYCKLVVRANEET